MRRTLGILFLSLACCGGPDSANPFQGADPGSTNSTTVDAVDYGNGYSAGLARMSEGDRSSTLAQAVRSTNRRCASMTRAEYKGSFEQRAFWAAQCGSADYLLTIASDGTVRAETCAVAATYGPGCWVEW